MFVLIGLDSNGRTVEVGLYDDEAAMHLYVHQSLKAGRVYSVFTPSMNDVIGAPATIHIQKSNGN